MIHGMDEDTTVDPEYATLDFDAWVDALEADTNYQTEQDHHG